MSIKMLSILVIFFVVKHADGQELYVKSDRMPYQASLRLYYNNDHHCSGSIIGIKHILTAGHCVCVYVKFYMLYVVLGADSYIAGGDVYRLDKSICHEDFNKYYLKNDIAILITINEIDYSNRVRPIPLINFNLPRNAMLVLSIWGYKREYVIPPLFFQLRVGYLIDTEYCAAIYSTSMVDHSNICTFTQGLGACVGDSGGPVIYKGYLAGIISFGKNCLIQYPNVHANISYYYDWIEENLFYDSDD